MTSEEDAENMRLCLRVQQETKTMDSLALAHKRIDGLIGPLPSTDEVFAQSSPPDPA